MAIPIFRDQKKWGEPRGRIECELEKAGKCSILEEISGQEWSTMSVGAGMLKKELANIVYVPCFKTL